MPTYATPDDVARHNPHRTYTATSKPTETQVQAMIDYANGKVSTQLMQVGVDINAPTFTKANHPEFWVLAANYAGYTAAGLAERASLAGGGGDSEHVKYLERERDSAHDQMLATDLVRLAGDSVRERPWSNEIDNPNDPPVKMSTRF